MMRDLAMTQTFPTDQSSLRRARLSQMLRRLRDRGSSSRAGLAAELGLARSVVGGLVDELVETGLVQERGVERGGVGRPGTALALSGGAVCGIGAEINVDHLSTVAVDLAGTTLHEQRRGLDAVALGAHGVLDELAAMLLTSIREVMAQGTAVAGVGVGVAGLVDVAAGSVALAPNLGWRGVPLVAELTQRLELLLGVDAPPVVADNEANLAALAEIDPRDPGRDDMLVLYGEVGVGGGVVADGRLLRGRHGWAGELGHMILDPQGRACGCGRVGCWETVTGLRALLATATEVDDLVRDPSLTLEERLDVLADRARRGDHRTRTALHQVGSWLGRGAAGLVNVLDPGVVVLGGYFAVLGEWLLPAMVEQLEAGAVAPRSGGTRVVLSSLGPTAAVRGGALVALEVVLADPTGVAALHPTPVTHGGVR